MIKTETVLKALKHNANNLEKEKNKKIKQVEKLQKSIEEKQNKIEKLEKEISDLDNKVNMWNSSLAPFMADPTIWQEVPVVNKKDDVVDAEIVEEEEEEEKKEEGGITFELDPEKEEDEQYFHFDN